MPASQILKSDLFRDDERLQKTAVDHRFHVQKGDYGVYVYRIQFFLLSSAYFEEFQRFEEELGFGTEFEAHKAAFQQESLDLIFGPQTAVAVKGYKIINNIVGRSYQQAADAIVGVMTIRHMDKEAQRPGFGGNSEQREAAAALAPISAKPAMMASPQVAGRMLSRMI
jgi:hypothetical protein